MKSKRTASAPRNAFPLCAPPEKTMYSMIGVVFVAAIPYDAEEVERMRG
jgi:hypothetical protein